MCKKNSVACIKATLVSNTDQLIYLLYLQCPFLIIAINLFKQEVKFWCFEIGFCYIFEIFILTLNVLGMNEFVYTNIACILFSKL